MEAPVRYKMAIAITVIYKYVVSNFHWFDRLALVR